MTEFAKIDKYEVVEQIGEGSFGTVYKGRDPFLKRDVAIKICTLADVGLRKRFFREAEIAGNLQHKNIVTVFAFGFEGEVPYLVQEYLPGKDLRQLIEEGTEVPTVDKLDVLLQVASGLDYAHGEGVVHRDIKPANVRLLDGGVVKIMDFGIAKLASAETQLTQKGVAMGTATYLPPEQVRGGDIDHRADLFSLGVLAYELLTYERPFRGNTVQALIYQILYKPPVPIKTGWSVCPDPLAKVVERCLEKDPDRRYPSAEALIPELRAVRDRVAAGEWPAARKPPPTPRVAASSQAVPPQAEDSRARTLRIPAVVAPPAKKVAPPAEKAAPPAEKAAPPAEKDDESTQPIPIIVGDSEPAAEAAAVAPTAAAEAPPLTDAAEEIQRLIAQGELEEARRRLEKTIARQKAVKVPPTAAAAHKPSPPTAAAAHKPSPPTAAAARKPSPSPAQRAQRTPKVLPPRKVAGAPAAGVVARLRSMLPPRGKKWGLAAVGAVALVLALGWLAGRGGEEPPPTVAAPPPPPLTGVVPISDPGPALGVAVVNALPWAEVTEITDADGFVRGLPEILRTPFVLELPAGNYRVTLQHPEHPELATCELEVSAAEVASCNLSFAEPTALEYFKDSGWWR